MDLAAALALGAQRLDLPLPALRRRRPEQLAPSTAEDGEQLEKQGPCFDPDFSGILLSFFPCNLILAVSLL